MADPDSGEIWITAKAGGGRAAGFCYAAAETLADGIWNLRAIAVLPAEQGEGRGAALCAHLEAELRAQRQRIVVVDTAGTDDFAATRDFYGNIGYVEEARIREFWAKGDDKVIFSKSLAQSLTTPVFLCPH